MTKVYYAVYDKQAEIYSPPFLEVKDGTAIRAVQDIVINNKDHVFAKHPSDFSLHRLGEFDETKGVITGKTKPEKIIEIETLGE
ncbi:MAG: nonstructural protein [Microviridae sp.]|nr:MAG: nonstructural protein [Microviridae sp.]